MMQKPVMTTATGVTLPAPPWMTDRRAREAGPAQGAREVVSMEVMQRGGRFGEGAMLRQAVTRRKVSATLAALPAHLRRAGEAYAAAVEAVEAGGASDPVEGLASGGGAPSGTCRQFHAMGQVEALRAFRAAIGARSIVIAYRANRGTERAARREFRMEVLALVEAVCLEGRDLTAILREAGLTRTRKRMAVLLNALVSALDRARCCVVDR